jgi:hypothetical protein
MNQLTNKQLVLKTRPLFRYSPRINAQRAQDTTTTTITLTGTNIGDGGIFDSSGFRSGKNGGARFFGA